MSRQTSKIVTGITAICAALLLQSCSRTEKGMSQQVALTDLSSKPHQTGDTSWTRYWRQALKYPAEAKEKKLEGSVVVKFIVDENGNVINPSIAKSTDPIFSQVALDNIKQMPKWKPAEKFGHKIAVEMYQPFLYALGLNGSTSVMTVSADTSLVSSEMISNNTSSYMSAMVHGDKLLEANAKAIEREMQNITKANNDIAKAQKEAAAAQKEMDKLLQQK